MSVPHQNTIENSGTPKRIAKRRSNLVRPARIGLYGFLIVSTLFYLIPFYIVFTTSIKPMDEIRNGSIFNLPKSPTLEPWGVAWSSACSGLKCEGLRGGFGNSLKIAIPSVIISVLLGAINGYSLSLWRFKGSEAIMFLLLFGAFIPYQVILYPMFLIVRTIGLYNSLPGVVFIHVVWGLPVITLIFRNFYVNLPPDLFKAAKIDGGGFFQIFYYIMLPMSATIFVVGIIYQLTGIWNDYLFGTTFAGLDNLPMTVQLNTLVGEVRAEKEYNVNMAATLITAFVPLVIYLLSGNYFVRGITAGAVKG